MGRQYAREYAHQRLLRAYHQLDMESNPARGDAGDPLNKGELVSNE